MGVHLLAEVAPAAPAAVGAAGLLALAGLFVTLGLIKFSDYFCRALFGTASSLVSWIPWLGSKANNGLHAVEQRLTDYLGRAALSVDHAIATVWHVTAHTVEYLVHEMVRQSIALYHLATSLPHDVTKIVTQTIPAKIGHVTKIVEHTTTTVIQRVVRVERVVTHTVAHTLPSVARSVAIELERPLLGDIAGLRERVKALEDGAVDLYRKAKGVITVPAVAAASAVVAVALTALGLNWIRCRNWNRVGRQVCRMPANDLEALLGLFVAGVAVADLRDTVKLLQKIEHEAAEAIETVLKV